MTGMRLCTCAMVWLASVVMIAKVRSTLAAPALPYVSQRQWLAVPPGDREWLLNLLTLLM
jgi:hypothetical protein